MLMARNKMGFSLIEVAQKNSPTVIPDWKKAKDSRNNITKTLAKAIAISEF
jgi:hypothetical protein